MTRDPNAVILKLIEFRQDQGGTYTDTLLVTTQPPFGVYGHYDRRAENGAEGYLKDHDMNESASAVELMSYMRSRYKIDNNYSAEDTRTIAGLRYELNVRYAGIPARRRMCSCRTPI